MHSHHVGIQPGLLHIPPEVIAKQRRLRDGTRARGEFRLCQAHGARQVAE